MKGKYIDHFYDDPEETEGSNPVAGCVWAIIGTLLSVAVILAAWWLVLLAKGG